MAGNKNSGDRKAPGKRPAPATAISKLRAHEIIKSGSAPLDIMLDNMMFWHTNSKDLAERAAELFAKIDADTDATPTEKIEMLKAVGSILKNFTTARENSQSCAVDAAPYIHPRLQAISFQKPLDEVLIIEADLLAPIAGDTEKRDYRTGYEKVVPLKRTA